MLPLPGTPSCSWARFRERFRAIFSGADPRVCVAFWLFGKIDRWPQCDRLTGSSSIAVTDISVG